MNTLDALILFGSSVLLFICAVGLIFKGVFKKMIAQVEDMVPTHALPYTKCAVGMSIAFGITFRETWQPVTGPQMAAFLWSDWVIFLGAPVLAALLYFQGFLDRSLDRADKARAENTGNTQPPMPIP